MCALFLQQDGLCLNMHMELLYYFEMGQDSTHSLQLKSEAMADYKITEKSLQSEITYLLNIKNQQEYMLREHRFNELRQFTTLSQRLEKRIKIKHRNLTNLQKVQARTEDQLCSNFYKIYTLWEYPKHSLTNQISDRIVKNHNFENKDLWNIITSVVQPMALLETNQFKHETLSTKGILLDHQDIIKVADPLTNTYQNNLECIYAHRVNKNIYLSPQQCDSIVNQKPIINKNTYKNDVFAFGVILLECGLLQTQEKCYLQEYQGINWRVLTDHISHFGNIYGHELKKTVQTMTKRSYQQRPSWIELCQYLSSLSIKDKAQSKKLSQNISSYNSYELSSNQSNQNHYPISHSNNYPHPVSLPTSHSPVNNQPTFHTNTQNHYITPFSTMVVHNYNKPPVISTNNVNMNKEPLVSNNARFGGSIVMPSNVKPQERVIHFNHGGSVPMVSQYPVQNVAYNNQIHHVQQNTAILSQPNHFNFGGTFSKQSKANHFLPVNTNINQYAINQPQIIQFKEQNFPINNPNQPYQHFKEQPVPMNTNKQEIATLQANQLGGSENELQFVEERFKMGSRYEGYKLNGMRHGRGKFFYQDGGSYDGQWKINKMSGFGKLYYQSNKIAYEGDWVDDQFQGTGKLYNESPIYIETFDYLNFDQIDDNWEYYQGQFLGDLKNGKGVLKFTSGQVFEGHFFDDMVEGEGNFMFNDGRIIRGMWHQNQLKEYIG